MQKPSLGWQSWSPPFPSWHGFPRWDYSPFKTRSLKSTFRETPERAFKVRYWCSWYAYGWNITNHKIRETLSVISKHKLPFTHIIIDDGWTTWGDWHAPDSIRFPNMATTTKLIRKNHLQAGLWFAPFLANKKSQLFKKHPDWFVKHQGKYVQGLKTMPVWEWFLPQQYLLNFELPEVKKYITNFIDLAVNKWGIPLLKLDFLYAPYFNPLFKSDKLAHNQVTWLFHYIKSKYPHVQTIASGAPFTPIVGLADIIRISKDTALPPVVPKLFNQLIYSLRIKMLNLKLSTTNVFSNIAIDPDVRLFSLDTRSTTPTWDTIRTSVLGVGDNLTSLSTAKLQEIKIWLTNHNSQ